MNTKFKKGQIPHNKGIKKYLDLDKIYNKHIKGKSILDISKEIGVSDGLIRLRLKENGFKIRDKTKPSKETKNKIRDTLKRKGIKPKQRYTGEVWNKGKKGVQVAWNKGILGEESSSWKGGISKEPYSFDFNEELKMLIRKRDNFKCQLCSAPAVNVHHIDYNKKNSNQNNFVTLCDSCHIKTNFNREQWTTFFHSLLSKLYGYNY
ncbi:MAG: hypothetical protein M0R17_06155 [Candidatus Omnitrophica bacterium]|jgi:hypothetical protein|nr:hypothetical protein [Candidatus Omnitrophota bacterium]